jgi:hypothetical protein
MRALGERRKSWRKLGLVCAVLATGVVQQVTGLGEARCFSMPPWEDRARMTHGRYGPHGGWYGPNHGWYGPRRGGYGTTVVWPDFSSVLGDSVR